MHCIILFPPGFSSNEKTDPTNSIQDSPVTAEAWIPRSESRGVSGDGWGIRWSENVCHLNQQKSSGGDPQQSQKWMNNEHAALQNTGCLQFFRCCLTSNRFFFPKNIYIYIYHRNPPCDVLQQLSDGLGTFIREVLTMRIFVTLPVRGCQGYGGIWPWCLRIGRENLKEELDTIFRFSTYAVYIYILYMYISIH